MSRARETPRHRPVPLHVVQQSQVTGSMKLMTNERATRAGHDSSMEEHLTVEHAMREDFMVEGNRQAMTISSETWFVR